jgi:hypothetical protein
MNVRLARFSQNPNGIPAQSSGSASPRAYPGSSPGQPFQPQRGCGQGGPWPGEGKGRNHVAVDDFVWTRTLGRLADSPTQSWRTQSPWDCQNGRASELRGASWTAAGSEAPRRFRAGDDPQTLAAPAGVRKRRRRCALPAQSKTRTEMRGAPELRGALGDMSPSQKAATCRRTPKGGGGHAPQPPRAGQGFL